MINLHFLIPGDIDTPAGEYIYNKNIIVGLRNKKYKVFIHNLPGDFPFPGENSISHCEIILNSIPGNDIIFVHSSVFGSNLKIIESCAQNHKLIGLIHIPVLMGADLSIYQKEILAAAEKVNYLYVKHYIVSNEYALNELVHKGIPKTNISLVPPGIEKYPIKKDYPPVPKKLLCIASYTRKNGLINLIKALSALKTKDWELACYGIKNFDTHYVDEINNLIRRNKLTGKITLNGPVPHDNISSIYQEADLFIMPSDQETFGMTISEALMHGIPFVASSGGLINKAIPRGMGKFFKPGNVYDIQSILELLFDNEPVYKTLCLNASNYHTQTRTWEDAVTDFEKNIQKINALFPNE